MTTRFLLDTHCLLWFKNNDPKISVKAMDVIQDPANTILFSQISLFEITIKQTLNKLPAFTAEIDDIYLQGLKDNFTFIQLQNQHLYHYKKVALFEEHRDPFDRLLIATAITENATILTVDKNFRLYNDVVDILW